MSGFVAILNLDRAPVDRALLERMTQWLAYRGPDAQEVWCEASIGFGHTLLEITRGLTPDKQPARLGDHLWVVADARIDARAELLVKLKAKSRAADSLSLLSTDAQFILHAYDAWGEACVEHLLGDFSFVIWDAPKERLFCARDHFGVKPFFYAHVGTHLIVSNTLNCIRQHPSVSNRLNDLAIADFLLFNMNQDLSTTSFADIRRLPPAHVLVHERGSLSAQRYWELSVTTPIRYARETEYVEHFRELLDAAVADRMSTDSAGVLMSGGLDSPTVAASAQRVLARDGNHANLRAYTEVFDSLIPHEERRYAKLAADALGMPIEYLVSDHRKIFERAEVPEHFTPEPTHSACPDTNWDLTRQVSLRSRVAFTGYGGDPTLSGRISVHFQRLLEKRQFGRALGDALRFLTAEGRLSRLYIPLRLRILFAARRQGPLYPRWLNEDFERRLGLHERSVALSRGGTPPPSVRPEAHALVASPLWPNLFESHDSGLTRLPLDVRHPIFDLRLVNFLLALPRLPWCSDKELLREACRGELPDAVRLRRKTPLPVDLLVALLDRPEAAWIDRFEPIPELDQYVVRKRIPAVHRERNSWSAFMHLGPLSLNFWLRSMNW